jgi:transposase
MMDDTTREALLIKELATLREEVSVIIAENKSLREEIDALKQTNHVLRLKIDAMARKLFGKSSEKLDPAQLQLVFDALENESASAPPKPVASDSESTDSEAEPKAPRKKRSFEQLVERLPIEEIIIDPAEVIAQPEAFVCMGEERTKLIDFIPAQFRQQHIVRRKYVSKEERHLPPIIAPLRTLQERCIASPRLLAHTIAQRFELHLPFYRIEQQCERMGLPIPRQTLCGWAGMAHDASQLIIEHIKRDVFADGYVMIDETPVKYQDPERKGVCGTGYLWVVHNPVRNITHFEWKTSRAAKCLHDIIPANYIGIIQSDGYSAYEAFIKQRENSGQIQLAGCLAHARRKFYEAKDASEDARWALAQMQSLYRIEARLREARAGPAEVRHIRQRESAVIMQRLHEHLQHLQTQRTHLPRSLTGEAISYALNQWAKLEMFLRDGRVQIDNNLVENAIRPSAIGKKNYPSFLRIRHLASLGCSRSAAQRGLFMGDASTGDRAATFYTLIGNCHREGVNAEAYLADIFARLPTETNQTVHRLTPKAWAAERLAAAEATRAQSMARGM